MSVSGISSSGLNFTGLATGIDTAKIITGLTSLNQQRIDRYKSQQSDIATKQTAFAAIQAKMYDLQSKTLALAKTAGGAFDGRLASTSDTTAATAVAGTAAVAGTYTLNVTSLAKSAQVATAGFDDPNTQLKTGTLTVSVGSGTATTVTVDSRNNTLQGLADSINAAGGDARASVVRDSATQTYKLLFTSGKTGAANAIAVDASGLTGGTGADLGALTTVQAATDAQVSLGGSLTVSSPTNQINGLIPGVTVNLLQENKTFSVTVAPDTDTTVKAVGDFVSSYNAVKDLIADQTKYDPSSQNAGVLLGNRDVASLSDDLSSALSATIPGLNSGANRLSSVGLAFNNNGDLTFDSDKFTAALTSSTAGTTQADFKKLFSLSGTSDTTGVGFFVGSSQTKASGATPYQANVTSPATRAVVLSSGPPAAVVVVPANAALQLKINSLAAQSVSIPAGTYNSTADLIAAIQKAINTTQASSDDFINVGQDGSGKLQFTTNKYGSGAGVSITGVTVGGTEDDGLFGQLGFSGATSASGTDVAGNFVVNGQTEAATGSGQILIGLSGNTNTDGLQVKATTATPASANVTVTQGLASRLNTVLNKYLDPINGRFKAINDAYTSQSDDIGKTIDKQNDILTTKTTDLQTKFAAMETAVNTLKGLQTQLSSLTATAASK